MYSLHGTVLHARGGGGYIDEVCSDKDGWDKADEPKHHAKSDPCEVFGDPDKHVQVLVLPEILEDRQTRLQHSVVIFKLSKQARKNGRV
jgi:hypothetical protein